VRVPVNGDVRAVRARQVRVEGVVFYLILVVAGFAEPGGEVPAGGDATGFFGGERRRSLCGARDPEVAISLSSGVEDFVGRDRREDPRRTVARVGHRRREEFFTVTVFGERFRSRPAGSGKRRRRADRRQNNRERHPSNQVPDHRIPLPWVRAACVAGPMIWLMSSIRADRPRSGSHPSPMRQELYGTNLPMAAQTLHPGPLRGGHAKPMVFAAQPRCSRCTPRPRHHGRKSLTTIVRQTESPILNRSR
jgi:hypothetical protein